MCRPASSEEEVVGSREATGPGLLTGAWRKAPARFVERPLPTAADASAESLAALIAAALDEAGGSGLPVHVTFADALVRYFIVTPADNGVRMQDLRAAASGFAQIVDRGEQTRHDVSLPAGVQMRLGLVEQDHDARLGCLAP